MSEKLIALSTDQLLQKFGAGDHKPGSGSAAALQGMLSAKLLLTVIDLTCQEKRKRFYESWLPELKVIAAKIDSEIFPSLERFFQEDSDQFDKTIKLRKARDNERDQVKHRQLTAAALEELRIATETPIAIGNLCLELAYFSVYVFDHGFKSARGDAGVAQNGAVAAIAGCLSIINLNLLSFENSAWKEEIRGKVSELKAKYDNVLTAATERIETLKREVDAGDRFDNDVKIFLESIVEESALTSETIEQTAKDVQNLLWKYKSKIWKHLEPEVPLEVLSAEKALRNILGFEFYKEDTLGSFQGDSGFYEVAGVIDSVNKTVHISRAFQKETQNFTTAHELGHALFHKEAVMHRDRPLDGSNFGSVRDKKELQADKFAAYFLLPAKQVEKTFAELFKMNKFVVREDTVFALTSGNVISFRRKYTDLRALARVIAAANFFAGQSFQSMAEIFQVSIETMAIRLEELGLVEF